MGMDPITLALGVAGLLASVAGTVYSASQEQKMADYNADVAAQNAQMAEDKAAYDAKMHNREVRRVLANQRSLYGKSGLSEEGSPLLVMEDSLKQGAMDALAIRYGGDVEASKQRSQANLFRMQGKNIMTSGAINAGTTLLSGASKLYKG
jgi:type IV secretory pathway VirJ component